ncbi:MAG: flagellar hook-associated protein FlgL [Chitinispirillaceae bacterium]|nr:flagellar hook-associated protein FlgL [Chitinispirillaceae bacterium]
MRITANQIIKNMVYVINDRFYDMSRLQEQLSTGKRLLRPSDAPVDVANDLKLKTKLAEIAQFKSNIEDGLSFMNVTDTAMMSMTELLQRMRELSIEASTDTMSGNERFYINKEVEQLLRQVVALVNTQYKADYIFNGTQTKVPPLILQSSTVATPDDYANLRMAYFNAGGLAVPATVQLFNGFDDSAIQNIIPGTFNLQVGTVTYRENTDYTIDYLNGTITIINPALAVDVSPGTANYAPDQFRISFDYLTPGKDIYGSTVSNHGHVLREIETGITMAINISGDEFMNDPTTGSNLLGTIITLGQDLLQDNRDGIAAAIERIDTVFSAVLSAQSKNGARINRFDTTLRRNEGQFTTTTELQANLEDAEMTKTITDFMNTQNVYNAALKTAANVIQQSLVNFL